jgi:hypothetical protein
LRKRNDADGFFRERLKGGSLMSRTFHHGERRIRVRGIRRENPDLSKLARALLELAQAQAEADAEAEHRKTKTTGNVVELHPKKPANPEKDAA